MAEVAFEGVSRRYGDTLALDAVTLTAPGESFSVLTGPPGAGKSTLLRLLVGLERPDAGRVLIGGRDVTDSRPATRPVGYVPQSFALYPHLSVARNIGYPLRLAGAPRAQIARKVSELAEMLSIGPLLDKTPDQLSGGEKQRVAVARGLSREATVFVLDDPLVGLDYKLRERLMGDLKTLRAELGATFVYATSDPLEALTMARSLVVLEGGRVAQAGPVSEVYAEPACAAALRLTGFPRANLTPGRWRNGAVEAGPFRFAAEGQGDGRAVLVGARPEALRLGPGPLSFEAEVALVEDLGSERVIYLERDGVSLTMAQGAEAGAPPRLGERLTVSVDPAALLVFDADDGARLARGRG